MSYYHNTMSSPFNRIPDLVFYVRLLIVLTFCTFAKLITIFPHTHPVLILFSIGVVYTLIFSMW